MLNYHLQLGVVNKLFTKWKKQYITMLAKFMRLFDRVDSVVKNTLNMPSRLLRMYILVVGTQKL